MTDCWQCLVDITDKMGTTFIELSDQLNKTPEVIQAYIKDAKKKKKTLNTTGSKLITELNKTEANSTKDESMEEYVMARNKQQKVNIVTKLGKQADQDTKATEKADKEYQEAVKKFRAMQEKFYKEDMPKLLQDYQTFEEERLNNLKTYFESTLTQFTPIPDSLRDFNNKYSDSIQSVDVQKDLGIFASKNKSGKSGPDYANYEPYDSSSSTNSTNTTTTTTATTSSTVPNSNSPSPSTSERNSLAQPVNSPVTTNSVSPPITRTNSSSANSTLSRYSTPPSEQTKVRAIYDYNATDDNELSFKANEIVTVLIKDGSGWWQGKLANGNVGMFPSNFVENIDAASNSSDPYHNKQCKALYDYPASEDTELSMSAGEILTIQSEENGWYFAHNSSKQFGRIPSNYVQLLD